MMYSACSLALFAAAVSLPTALSAPCDDFDMSIWKVTLPITYEAYFGDDYAGEDDAAQVEPDACGNPVAGLDDGFEDSAFFYSASSSSMVFRTPLIGDGTTPNTNFIRTELRELYKGECSTDDANWSVNGTHVLTGTLQVLEVFEDDPQTIVGQIHAKDSSKALVKLQYDGPTKDIRAIINEDPSSGNPFSFDTGLTPGYDAFSYEITLEDGTMTIAVTYNGDTASESYTFGSGDMSSDWSDHTFYFKAGSYPQADADSGGAFEVQFFDLEVSHSS